MNKRNKKLPACGLFLACAVLSGALLLKGSHQYASERRVYQTLQQLHREQNYQAFLVMNDDYIGWIVIPGTNINYPVMQENQKDFYLTHDFFGDEASGGSLYIPSPVPGFMADNVVILGHNMKDLSMFGMLKRYKNRDFLASHPIVELQTEEEIRQYRIFSVYEKDSEEGEPYRFASEEEKEHYIQGCMSRSIHGKMDGVTAQAESILTLSTCAATDQRLVIHACLIMRSKC